MSKFNTKKPNTNIPNTTNLAGGTAFTQSEKMQLVSILLTSFVKDQFYRGADDTLNKMEELFKNLSDKKFAAKAAIYARTEFGMRSITHVMASLIAKHVKNEQWTKNFYNKVVLRPDDTTEIMAHYISKYGKRPIPNSLKKGMGLALGKFDAYQLGKYKGAGKSVNMIDLVNIIHPKPTKKNSEAINKLINGSLANKETWESQLSAIGKVNEEEAEISKEQLRSDAWKNMVKEKKLGYFALLRNLRNIANDSPDTLDAALEMLCDEKLIKNPKNLVMPFRYITALDQFTGNDKNNRKIAAALSKAFEISLSNIPKLPGETLVAIDSSGSMGGRAVNSMFIKAAMFGAMLGKQMNADIITFSTVAENVKYNPADSATTIVKSIPNHDGGTSFPCIFKQIGSKKYDRIFILSDMQSWVSDTKTAHNAYKAKSGCDPFIYTIDLADHGSLQFPENKITTLAGFNEKLFDLIDVQEKDKNLLIKAIEAIEL